MYGGTDGLESLKDSQIEETILKLKSYNIKHIVLVDRYQLWRGRRSKRRRPAEHSRGFNPSI